MKKTLREKNWMMPLLLVGLAAVVSYGCSGVQTNVTELHVLDMATPNELKDFFRYTEDRIPLVNTHRGGARSGYPENALATFEHTLQHSWSMMEVDPRYTKDSVIVLFHDRTLERTSNGQGRVSDHTYEELKKLRLKDSEGQVTEHRIPTLSEALEWAKGKTILFLDNKDVPVTERIKKIHEHQAEANAVVMAYSFEDAKQINELDPDIMMQVFIPDEDAVERFEQMGIPWENIVAFVTHERLSEEYKTVLRLLNEKGVMAVIGTSRTLDKDYTAGKISKEELENSYRELIQSGAAIIEADLGIEAGQAVETLWPTQSSKQDFFGSN